jgi:Septum formation
VLSRLATAALLLALAACSQSAATSENDAADQVEVPELGACRVLTPEDISRPFNATEAVDCSEEHTAETFAVGTFPRNLADGAAVDDPQLGAFIYQTCSGRFQKFLGGDESLVMRSMLTWAWFRPTKAAWENGARWYRCDVVGGSETSEELSPLPKTAKGVLLGKPDDEWMSCANGETVAGSEKIPCSEPHTWRAVTTIKVGREEDPYPGERLVEVRTRDFCSDSVGAWMNYPVDYDFGYTYFHEAEWKAGNRRSICWAMTDK